MDSSELNLDALCLDYLHNRGYSTQELAQEMRLQVPSFAPFTHEQTELESYIWRSLEYLQTGEAQTQLETTMSNLQEVFTDSDFPVQSDNPLKEVKSSALLPSTCSSVLIHNENEIYVGCEHIYKSEPSLLSLMSVSPVEIGAMANAGDLVTFSVGPKVHFMRNDNIINSISLHLSPVVEMITAGPTHQYAVSCAQNDPLAVVWDYGTASPLHSISLDSQCTSLASNGHLVVCTTDKSTTLWDLRIRRPFFVIKSPGISSACNAQYLTLGTEDEITFVDVRQPGTVAHLSIPNLTPRMLRTDGKHTYGASNDNELFCLRGTRIISRIRLGNSVNAMHCNAGLFSVACDNELYLF
ncbi:hypothetical protein PCE1_002063 [Barthelona sp. PCE]